MWSKPPKASKLFANMLAISGTNPLHPPSLPHYVVTLKTNQTETHIKKEAEAKKQTKKKHGNMDRTASPVKLSPKDVVKTLGALCSTYSVFV